MMNEWCFYLHWIGIDGNNIEIIVISSWRIVLMSSSITVHSGWIGFFFVGSFGNGTIGNGRKR